MAERNPNGWFSDEEGTTLAELLVVIVITGVIGAITTVGVVQGFNAQLDATNVAETLDGMRIATQRVRDYAREADEVCASSTAQAMVLWTDDNNDGVVADAEKDIFELDTTVTPPVFQRRVPGGGNAQIIRDDILSGAIFTYDDGRLATEQPADELQCEDVPVTGAASPIRSVRVEFTVDHPDPNRPDLNTSTAVRIRNAGLLDEPNNAPVADFTFNCPSLSQTCSFDASASADPDGTIGTYTWDFGDGTAGSGVTTSHGYSLGDTEYDVTLLVVDNEGAVDTVKKTVKPGLLSGNEKPAASFTYSCTGRICSFDGSASTDDGSIQSWSWNFGDGATASGQTASHTFTSDGTYSVELVVTDNLGEASDPEIKSVTASDYAMRVESLNATISNKTNNYDVTFAIQLSSTTAGSPGDGITVSVQLDGGKKGTESCSTDTTGSCTIEVKNVSNQTQQSLSVTNVTDAGGTYTYDDDQDKVDQIVVDKNGVVARYKDGEIS